MADIFDEIEEDLKRDKMQLFWARYGKIVAAAVAAIILLVALRQGYVSWRISQTEDSASAYQQALQSDDVVKALEAQLGHLSDGYEMLAQFQIAAEQAVKSDWTAAEAEYLALSSDKSIDPIYRQAAILLSVMAAPQDADVSVLEARLYDLEIAAGPWQAMALETAAGLALRNSSKGTALTKYKRLIELADVPAGIRQRAERMIMILSD